MEVRESTPEQERRLRMMAYVLLAVFGILGFWRMETINDRVERESSDRVVEQCENLNDNRKTILTVVEYVADDSRQGTDFSLVPGFTELEPSMQAFLMNLSNSEQRDASMRELVNFARELVPLVDCERLVKRGQND